VGRRCSLSAVWRDGTIVSDPDVIGDDLKVTEQPIDLILRQLAVVLDDEQIGHLLEL
jgi:hypothetical protein